MATDLTLTLPKVLLVKVLSFTDPVTFSRAAVLSKHWLAGVRQYDLNLGINDELAKEVILPQLRARLSRLFQRPGHEKQSASIRQHLQNPDCRFTEIGLFYPYKNEEQNQAVEKENGLTRNKARRETMIKGLIPRDENAKKKSELLTQACTYGNLSLFKLLLASKVTLDDAQIALAKDCANPHILKQLKK
jgi:hypothetical protein